MLLVIVSIVGVLLYRRRVNGGRGCFGKKRHFLLEVKMKDVIIMDDQDDFPEDDHDKSTLMD